MNSYLRRILLFPGTMLSLLFFAIVMLAIVPSTTKTSAAPDICHAAMVLDRSGSVGPTNLETMRNQVRRLFQPGGLYHDQVQLAFWSFSHSGNSSVNYDAPFHDFVSSRAGNTTSTTPYNSRVNGSGSFDQQLANMISDGNTNYEQGFAYNNGVVNTRDGIDDIVAKAHIIVFMTDGLPNTPGSGDNNSTARNAGRAAVLKHKAAGKIIIGGMIGSASQRSLNYVINGNDNNSSNTFRISTTYEDLARKLKEIIGNACDLITTPYSLTPSVTANKIVVTGNDTATFSYNVHNSASTGGSNNTAWTVRRVLVDRGQSVDPLFFGGQPYRDNYSCGQLISLINGRGSCTQVASGQRSFNPGNTSLDNAAGAASNVVIDQNWRVGTKVCYVLTLDQPTEDNSPTNRFSRAACLTVGERPLVQIHGGDLRVGRSFINNNGSEAAVTQSSTVKGSLSLRSEGRLYGSWSEYGVFAPGGVEQFASLSGLAGGYPTSSTNSQELWSKLTFANLGNQYGFFTPSNNGMGTIPNARTLFLTGRNVVNELTGVNSINLNGTQPNGIYRKTTGNLNIDASTIESGRSYIVYVPEGTVTITGNVSYDQGPYTDISQIPSLVIIAKDITIRSPVSRVDAWLIADGGGGGTIRTCEEPGNLSSQICNRQLITNGPVMAKELNLRRTGGVGSGSAPGDPAEIFNLSAGYYLWAHKEGRSDVRAQTVHVVELPPYF